MKTSVKNMMMSLALVGCIIFGASDAMAQGRSRSHGGSATSRSQSAAVSRSNNNSTAPTVSRNSDRPSSVSHSSHSNSVKAGAMAPSTKDQRSHSGTLSRSNDKQNTIVRENRPSTMTSTDNKTRGGKDRNGSSMGKDRGDNKDRNSGTMGSDRGAKNRNSGTMGSDRGSKDRNNGTMGSDRGSKDRNNGTMGNDRGNKDRNNGTMDNDRRDNKDRNNGTMGNDRRDNKDRHGNRPGIKPGNDRKGNNGKPRDNRSFDSKHRFDYGNHHYRDEFSWNHSHHNWSRPLPPPVRAYRPAPIVWRRPVIPVGWRPYAGAPVIDRILGLMFGSLYEASLDHLYYNGYYIDGYADGIIYLRDVSMLNLYWPDVMLNYELGRLANAQFVYHSSYYDRARFDRAYNSLCRIYGSPVIDDGATVSWFGGNNTGWVTLTMTDNHGDYYTTMSIGY